MITISGRVTQPWNDTIAEHIQVTCKATVEIVNRLLVAGFRPFLVSWLSIATGAPRDLKCRAPKWESRVKFSQALEEVYFERANQVVKVRVDTGFVYYCQRKGASVVSDYRPLNPAILLGAEELQSRGQ